MNTRNKGLTVQETAVFAMLGALMFATKKAMEILPNIHLLGMFIMVFTVVFRKKALFPIYVYVLLEGLFSGFGLWWISYLYIWAILWAATMLLNKNMSAKRKKIVYPVVCSLHGLFFGILTAPAQALLFHLNFKGTLSWIAAGLPYDLIHAAGNFVFGLLVFPLSERLKKIADSR